MRFKFMKACIFPYDGMIRIRLAGQSAYSLNLSRKHPTPRRQVASAIAFIIMQEFGFVNPQLALSERLPEHTNSGQNGLVQ